MCIAPGRPTLAVICVCARNGLTVEAGEMHEYGMAASLVSQVEETVRAHAGRRAARVVVGVSDVTAVEQQVLRGAFEMLKAGTSADRAELALEAAPLKVFCPECGVPASVRETLGRRCPACGAAAIPVGAQDIVLKSVEIEA